jgi:alpha-1,6-mannosyltransferase
MRESADIPQENTEAAPASAAQDSRTKSDSSRKKRSSADPNLTRVRRHKRSSEDEDRPFFSGDIWDLVTLIVVILYVYNCPFTKVEESFNIQATHDLLVHTFRHLPQFDHNMFPGVVPRTFVGPIFLYFFSQSIISTFEKKEWTDPSPSKVDPMLTLYIVRAVLGVFFVHSLRSLRQTTERVFGPYAGNWFALINLTQFHLMFWGSRTLPNVFALIFMNWATSCWINGFKPLTTSEKAAIHMPLQFGSPADPYTGKSRKQKLVEDMQKPDPWIDSVSLGLLSFGVFAALVFRLELLALFGPIILSDLLHKRLKWVPTIIAGIVFSAISIAITVGVDSFFWGKPYFWPELEVFKFNILEDRAKEYGVSPFHFYYTNLLPRVVPFAYPMAIGATLIDKRVRRMLFPAFIFVTVMSFIGHKEWRFVFYVIPLINIAAAVTFTYFSKPESLITDKPAAKKERKSSSTETSPPSSTTPSNNKVKKQSTLKSLVYHTLILTIFASIGISFISLIISRQNYPGGRAMKVLHVIAAPSDPSQSKPFVHIDTYSATNGVSRFLETGRNSGWVYSKIETHKTAQEYLDAGYTHLLTESPDFHGEKNWKILGHIKGFSRLQMDPRGLYGWSLGTYEMFVKNEFKWKQQDPFFGLPLPFKVILEPKIFLMQRVGWKN